MTTPNTAARHDMLDKVRKLFAKAESVAGTPEADTFNAKAYALISKYGIDETAARERAGEGPAPIITIELTLSGAYITQQRYLLQALATALHCAPVYIKDRTFGTTRDFVTGTANHTDRVQVLFSMLMPQMLVGAGNVRPPAGSRASTATYRRSWMTGFLKTVETRLAGAEAAAAEEQPGTGLVLLTDAKRAEAQLRADAMARGGRVVAKRSRSQHDENAAGMGAKAGASVNLGGTALGERLALTV
jgi:hypothetical protein